MNNFDKALQEFEPITLTYCFGTSCPSGGKPLSDIRTN